MDVVHAIEVARPLEEVYGAFNNPGNLPRWLTGLERTERIEGEPGEVGSKTRQVYLERGRVVEMVETITAHEAGRLFEGTLEAPGMHSTLRVEFDDLGDRTGVRFTGSFRPDSVLMTLMAPFLKRVMRKRQAADLATFKRLVEAGEIRA